MLSSAVLFSTTSFMVPLRSSSTIIESISAALVKPKFDRILFRVWAETKAFWQSPAAKELFKSVKVVS